MSENLIHPTILNPLSPSTESKIDEDYQLSQIELDELQYKYAEIIKKILDKKIESVEQFKEELKAGKHLKQEDLALLEKMTNIAYYTIKDGVGTFALWSSVISIFGAIFTGANALWHHIPKAAIIQIVVSSIFDSLENASVGAERFMPRYFRDNKMQHALSHTGEIKKIIKSLEKEGKTPFAKMLVKKLGDSASYVNMQGAFNENDNILKKTAKGSKRVYGNLLNGISNRPIYKMRNNFKKLQKENEYNFLYATLSVVFKKIIYSSIGFISKTSGPNIMEDMVAGLAERFITESLQMTAGTSTAIISGMAAATTALNTAIAKGHELFYNSLDDPSVLGVRKGDDFTVKNIKYAAKTAKDDFVNKFTSADYYEKLAKKTIGRIAGRVLFEAVGRPFIYINDPKTDADKVINSLFEGCRNGLGQQVFIHFAATRLPKIFSAEEENLLGSGAFLIAGLEDVIVKNGENDSKSIKTENLEKGLKYLIAEGQNKYEQTNEILSNLKKVIEEWQKYNTQEKDLQIKYNISLTKYKQFGGVSGDVNLTQSFYEKCQNINQDEINLLCNYYTVLYKYNMDLEDSIKEYQAIMEKTDGDKIDEVQKRKILASSMISAFQQIDVSKDNILKISALSSNLLSKHQLENDMQNSIYRAIKPIDERAILEMLGKIEKKYTLREEKFTKFVKKFDNYNIQTTDFEGDLKIFNDNFINKIQTEYEFLNSIIVEMLDEKNRSTDKNEIKQLEADVTFLQRQLRSLNIILIKAKADTENHPSAVWERVKDANLILAFLQTQYNFNPIEKNDLANLKTNLVEFDSKVEDITGNENYRKTLYSMKMDVEKRIEDLEKDLSVVKNRWNENAEARSLGKIKSKIPLFKQVQKRHCKPKDVSKIKSQINENKKIQSEIKDVLSNPRINIAGMNDGINKIANMDYKIAEQYQIQPSSIIQNKGKKPKKEGFYEITPL